MPDLVLSVDRCDLADEGGNVLADWGALDAGDTDRDVTIKSGIEDVLPLPERNPIIIKFRNIKRIFFF